MTAPTSLRCAKAHTKNVLDVPTGSERLPVTHPSGCQQVAATFRYPAECNAPIIFLRALYLQSIFLGSLARPRLATIIHELFGFNCCLFASIPIC